MALCVTMATLVRLDTPGPPPAQGCHSACAGVRQRRPASQLRPGAAWGWTPLFASVAVACASCSIVKAVVALPNAQRDGSGVPLLLLSVARRRDASRLGRRQQAPRASPMNVHARDLPKTETAASGRAWRPRPVSLASGVVSTRIAGLDDGAVHVHRAGPVHSPWLRKRWLAEASKKPRSLMTGWAVRVPVSRAAMAMKGL